VVAATCPFTEGFGGLAGEFGGGHLPYITTMPKIIGGSLEEHREQTRRRVFDALTALLAGRSFDALTMAELASEAGIGRTAIYNHFADKDAVVVAFASAETDRYLARLGTALQSAEGPADAMGIYVREHMNSSEEFHFGFGPELYGMLSRESVAEIREHVVAVESMLRGIIEDGVAAGVFTVDDVTSTMALVHSCLSTRRVEPAAVGTFVLRALGA
jgi:AcrR family transcriptional regulator